jgi:hypothetical protein
VEESLRRRGCGLLQVLLAVVLFLVVLLVGGFLGYHLWMVSQGTTTYEAFKEKESRRLAELEKSAEDKESQPPDRSCTATEDPGQSQTRPYRTITDRTIPVQTRPPRTEAADGRQQRLVNPYDGAYLPSDRRKAQNGGAEGGADKGGVHEELRRGLFRERRLGSGGERGGARGERGGARGELRPYDRGWFKNFCEVLFPVALMEEAKKQL